MSSRCVSCAWLPFCFTVALLAHCCTDLLPPLFCLPLSIYHSSGAPHVLSHLFPRQSIPTHCIQPPYFLIGPLHSWHWSNFTPSTWVSGYIVSEEDSVDHWRSIYYNEKTSNSFSSALLCWRSLIKIMLNQQSPAGVFWSRLYSSNNTLISHNMLFF